MQRVSELVGKAVVSADTGEKLGSVSDLLVDPQAMRIVGLVISNGVLAAERVLPYEDVTTLGRDAIVTRTAGGVLGRREWRDRGVGVARSSTLKNRRVITAHGRDLGTIKDVFVRDETGEIDAYDVAGSAFAGLIQRRGVLPHSGKVVLGPDVIVVSDDAAHAFDAAGSEVAGGGRGR